MFEVLYLALVLRRLFTSLERTQVTALARLRVCLARVQSVPAGLELSDHGLVSFQSSDVDLWLMALKLI